MTSVNKKEVSVTSVKEQTGTNNVVSIKGNDKKALNNEYPSGYKSKGSLPPFIEAERIKKELLMPKEMIMPKDTCRMSPSNKNPDGVPRDDFNAVNEKRYEQQVKDLGANVPPSWDQRSRYTIEYVEFFKCFADFFDRDDLVEVGKQKRYRAKGDMKDFMEHIYNAFDKTGGVWNKDKIEAYLTPDRIRSRLKQQKDKAKNWGEGNKNKLDPHYVQMRKRYNKIYSFIEMCSPIKMPASRDSKEDEKNKMDGLFEDCDFLNDF